MTRLVILYVQSRFSRVRPSHPPDSGVDFHGTLAEDHPRPPRTPRRKHPRRNQRIRGRPRPVLPAPWRVADSPVGRSGAGLPKKGQSPPSGPRRRRGCHAHAQRSVCAAQEMPKTRTFLNSTPAWKVRGKRCPRFPNRTPRRPKSPRRIIKQTLLLTHSRGD